MKNTDPSEQCDYNNYVRKYQLHIESDIQLSDLKIQGKYSLTNGFRFSIFREGAEAPSKEYHFHYVDNFLVARRKGTKDCAKLMSISIYICYDLKIQLAHE